MKEKILLAALLAATISCSSSNMTWTQSEKKTIRSKGEVMRVLTIDNPEDSLMLRSDCAEFTLADLSSRTYRTLARKMVATVTSPDQDGVGIAGPQVGILRRIVAVQRFDKPGEPFEVYPNIKIEEVRGEKVEGPEGCLSVPGRRETVLRWRDITISYTSPETLRDTTETITDFTAVIFQHECDHLEGTLYIDRL